jgi:hypothetical protein
MIFLNKKASTKTGERDMFNSHSSDIGLKSADDISFLSSRDTKLPKEVILKVMSIVKKMESLKKHREVNLSLYIKNGEALIKEIDEMNWRVHVSCSCGVYFEDASSNEIFAVKTDAKNFTHKSIFLFSGETMNEFASAIRNSLFETLFYNNVLRNDINSLKEKIEKPQKYKCDELQFS